MKSTAAEHCREASVLADSDTKISSEPCDSIVATRTRGEISGTTDTRRKVLKLCRTQSHNSYQTYSISRSMPTKTVQRTFVSYHGAVVESIREYSQLLVSDIPIGSQYAPQTREYDRTSSCLVRQCHSFQTYPSTHAPRARRIVSQRRYVHKAYSRSLLYLAYMSAGG